MDYRAIGRSIFVCPHEWCVLKKTQFHKISLDFRIWNEDFVCSALFIQSAIFIYEWRRAVNNSMSGTRKFSWQQFCRNFQLGLGFLQWFQSWTSYSINFCRIFEPGWPRLPIYLVWDGATCISGPCWCVESKKFVLVVDIRTKIHHKLLKTFFSAEDCMFICPELDACVNSSVWCDGINHCPSGYDESFTHCSALLQLPAEILASLLVSIILMVCIFSTYIYR